MEPVETAPEGRKAPLWTESQVRRLVQLWHDRLSAARIARALGPEFTRNAVVGKLFRLGLRRSDEQRHEAQAQGARNSRGRRGPPAFPPMPLPPPTPCAVTPRLVDIMALAPRACRWPYPVDEATRFCGHPARPGGPYCPDHHAVAYFATLPPLTLEALNLRASALKTRTLAAISPAGEARYRSAQ